MSEKCFAIMSDDALQSLIAAMTEDIAETEEAIGQPGCYVNKRILAMDRKVLRAAKAELAKRCR